MADPSSESSQRNKQFLDAYLEFGIGHYYTVAKLLCDRISGKLSASESLSVGLEVSAQAASALDNLVTWYFALRKWKPSEDASLLVDILESTHIEDSHRLKALEHVKRSRADQFSRSFGIPWSRDDLQARRLDMTNWRYTVDQVKLNITKVLEDLSPAELVTSQGWIAQHLTTNQIGPSGASGARGVFPSVSSETAGTDQDGSLIIPTDSGVLNELADLTGNAAIGLFLLVRLLYITAFRLEPRSPAFVEIWQELHPSRSQGP